MDAVMADPKVALPSESTEYVKWTEDEILDLHEGLFVKSIRALFDDRVVNETRDDIISWIKDPSPTALSFRACCFALQVNWEEMQEHLLGRYEQIQKAINKAAQEEACKQASSSNSGRAVVSSLSQLLERSRTISAESQLWLWPEVEPTVAAVQRKEERQKSLIRRAIKGVAAGMTSLFGIPSRRAINNNQLALPL